MTNKVSFKIASEVPDPPEPTTDVLFAIGEESVRWTRAFTEETAEMELITADDLKVRAR